jgi:hypothetical protein
MIIFSLIETNYLRNNGLFKSNSTQSKGNRIVKMGILFFERRLTHSLDFNQPNFEIIKIQSFCDYYVKYLSLIAS